MRRLMGMGALAVMVAGGAYGATPPSAASDETGRLRLYAFGDLIGNAVSNAAGPGNAMLYKAASGAVPVTGPGRRAGSRAVVLDADVFSAPAVTQASNAFTVALWLRPQAAGSKKAGSRSNGMIASNGSGYYDGWRLLLHDWRTRCPTIELGRGKDKGALGVHARDSLAVGFWNHLAATWDGARVRLYVNGMLSAETPYAGPLVPPRGALCAGFSGYGVGSLGMAIDTLAVYDRALPPETVARIALDGEALPADCVALLGQAQAAAGAGARSEASQAYRALAGKGEAPAIWRQWAALAALRFIETAADRRAGVEACAAFYSDASVPETLRGQAIEFLAQICRRGLGGEVLPSRILADLPEHLELDAGDPRLFGLALAEAYQRERQFDAAYGVYRQLLTAAGDEAEAAAGIRQGYARALWQGGCREEARAQYAALAADTRLPESARGLAALAVAQVWREEGKYAEAAAAYRAVTGTVSRFTHLLDEARVGAEACANLLEGKPARDPEASRQRLAPLPEPAVRFVVSPKGRDTNPGTFEQPFATLERARDAVRAAKRGGSLPPGGACVFLRGGRYAVTNTFVLEKGDSGSFGAPVVYCAWPGERPVFDGGFRVRGFWRVRDAGTLKRLPEEARGHVHVANLTKQGYTALEAQASYGRAQTNETVRELFQDGQPLEIARWPNDGFLKMATANITNLTFSCPTNRLARWTQADDLMANGYWFHLWAECTVPLAAVDAATGVFTFRQKPDHNLRAGYPFYVLNLLEEIDRPGEWFLDRAAGRLYVWPLKQPWRSTLTLSQWNRPFVEARKVQEVVFRGLTFEYGRQNGMVLDACANVTVAGNVIRRLGGTALIVTQGANIRIYGNRMETLGHAGMRVEGGNRTNLTSGRIVIENNEVSHFARCSRTYNPALLLDGCGARVAHNHFHHAPSSAMRIEGNDHLIEYNRVEHMVRESDDQGGIDMWCNPSYRGVVIRYNLWRDIGGGHAPCGQAGIRFDDAISGMVVYGNRFERTSTGHFGGVQIHGGQDNIIDNNLFTACRYGVSFSAWGQKRWEDFLGRERIRNLMYSDVNITLPPYSKRYPELAGLPGKADVNSIWRNLFIGTEEALHKKPKGTETWENRVFAEAPDLEEVAACSPFETLPPEDEIGLYADPFRAAASRDF
ncbi:MAG TPA: right-handed parallel beta-helix repeat-containing protein [Kiritimatiellia bacterium]|nr:right-handed parallel beta-helix repeat-containing protein [Kiritimatiellia bacterium]